MNSQTIPRQSEIPLDAFDEEYRRAEIEHKAELETVIPELEVAAELIAPRTCRFFLEGTGTVLDIGCGIGTMPYLLARHSPAAQVVGVDISEDSIAYAREYYEPQAENLSYQVGSVESLSQTFEAVDMITCIGALHHFPSLGSAIHQIMATLKDDGIFFLSDFNRENIHSYFSEKEIRQLEKLRKLPEKVRNNKLKRQGYTRGEKARRFLRLMSFQAAYTPEELAEAFRDRYGFKGRMAGLNYIFAIYKLKR